MAVNGNITTGKVIMMIPEAGSEIVKNSVNLLGRHSGYVDLIMKHKNTNNRSWKTTGQQAFRRRSFHFKIVTITEPSSKGTWENYRVSITIPQGTKNSVTLLDASFLGALFGGFLHGLHRVLQTSNPFHPWLSRARRWIQLVSDDDNLPSSYHYSNISMVLAAGRNVSISSIEEVPIFKIVTTTGNLVEVRELAYYNTTGWPTTAIPLQIALAELFYKKQNEVISKPDVNQLGSDTAWIEDLFDVTTGNLTITLLDAFYVENQPATSSTATTSTNPIINLGCAYCFTTVSGLLTKGSKKSVSLFFNPPGLDVSKEGREANILSPKFNCVIDCYLWYLARRDKTEEQDMQADNGSTVKVTTRVKKFLSHQMVIDYAKTFVPLEVANQLANIGQIPVEATVVTKNPRNLGHEKAFLITTTMRFGTPATPTNPVLNLLLFPASVFDDTNYHACVVSSNGLSASGKCKVCYQWFSLYGKHFENCNKCQDCGIPKQDNGKHYLSCKGNSNFTFKTPAQRQKETKSNTTMTIKKEIAKEEQLFEHIHFADFECFTDKYGRHFPYLIILRSINGKEQVFWGKKCLTSFVDALLGQEIVGYLFFHNGSGYDANLVITGLLQTKNFRAKIKEAGLSILRRGTKILTAEIKTKPTSLKLRDFYLFIPSSLAKLCVDFKVPNVLAKKDFDHSKITSFETAELYKDEAIKYCRNDVTSLEYIYIKFSGALWKIAPGVLMPVQMSMASQALEMWKITGKKELIESLVLPRTLQDYNLFRAMYHGGRSLPTLAKYDSTLWSHMFSPQYEAWRMDGLSVYTKDQVQAFILNNQDKVSFKSELKDVDVVSLYPSVMEKFPYPCGNYTTTSFGTEDEKIKTAEDLVRIISSGKHPVVLLSNDTDFDLLSSDSTNTRSFNPKYDILKQAMFRSCYMVDMKADPNFIVAFLMRKNEDPHTGQAKPEQSLADLNNHWLTGVELFEAIRVGYSLDKVHSVITWEKSDYLFRTYIHLLFKVKEENKHDKTSSLYIAAKVRAKQKKDNYKVIPY